MLFLGWLISVPSRAQSKSADEFEIRAAMIFNLTSFIEWPASKMDSAHPEFVVCVLGSDPLAVNLTSILQGKHVGGLPVSLHRISSANESGPCHIVYIGVSERKSLASFADVFVKNNVLTISERSNAENPTQVIGLPTIDEHVRIEVNLVAAEKRGLKISSKLLRLATVSR